MSEQFITQKIRRRRRRAAEVGEKPKISNSKDAFEILHPILADLKHEEFRVLYMNRGNKVMSKEMISQGGISGTVIDTRLILKHAHEKLSSCMILAHNHPSENTIPSEPDKKISEKIKKAAEFIEM